MKTDNNTREKRMSVASNVFTKTISFIVGLVFLVIGIILFLTYDPAAYNMEGTGKIVEINEHYELVGEDNQLMHDVFIDYTVEGKTYEHVAFFEYDSSMKVGDSVSFFYMSEDPSQIAGDHKEITPYFGLGCALLGLAMLVINVVMIVRNKP